MFFTRLTLDFLTHDLLKLPDKKKFPRAILSFLSPRPHAIRVRKPGCIMRTTVVLLLLVAAISEAGGSINTIRFIATPVFKGKSSISARISVSRGKKDHPKPKIDELCARMHNNTALEGADPLMMLQVREESEIWLFGSYSWLYLPTFEIFSYQKVPNTIIFHLLR